MHVKGLKLLFVHDLKVYKLLPLKPCVGVGGAVRPSPLAFCLLLKIILRHPYLKILDLANLCVADAPMKKI